MTERQYDQAWVEFDRVDKQRKADWASSSLFTGGMQWDPAPPSAILGPDGFWERNPEITAWMARHPNLVLRIQGI